MADSKITKKHHPTGSLAGRIIAVSILLLVVPLFFQNFFLYNQEYEQKLEDTQADLSLLADERAHFIEEIIQMNWQFLEDHRATFEAGMSGNKELLHIQMIPRPQNVNDRFVLASKSKRSLIVGIVSSSTTALVAPLPFSLIGRDLPRSFPVKISLLDLQGKELWENIKFKEDSDLLLAVDSIGETGFKLQLSVEKNQVRGLHHESVYFRFASLVLFVGILGGGAVYFFVRRISRPLKNLCKTMERVSEGAAHARYTPDRMGFEINSLGIQFNQTLDALLHHTHEAEKERILREKLAGELRIGHEIQASLLPQHVPGLPGIDIGTGYLSSKEVNGDFYDLFRLENGQILLVVCDTAGKGISACLFSLGLRSMIRALSSVTDDLSELVRKTNDLYSIDAHDSSMFSTLWIGIYNPENQQLVYCSQGHPPALLIRDRVLEELWTPGIALGAQKVDVISTKTMTLKKGDTLVLYTDGIIEAHDPDQELFGKKRFYELLLRKKTATAQQIADRILENVQLFSQDAPQHDDMTLIVFCISN